MISIKMRNVFYKRVEYRKYLRCTSSCVCVCNLQCCMTAPLPSAFLLRQLSPFLFFLLLPSFYYISQDVSCCKYNPLFLFFLFSNKSYSTSLCLVYLLLLTSRSSWTTQNNVAPLISQSIDLNHAKDFHFILTENPYEER